MRLHSRLLQPGWKVAALGLSVLVIAALFGWSVGGAGPSEKALASTTASTPATTTLAGSGYWLVGADGGVFDFGDAQFHGSGESLHLRAPIVGIAATPDGGGYWLVASDGGVFSYGDAAFHGSTGGLRLNKPIVGLAATPDGGGYWLVASDGGVFSYGDAAFHGSTGGLRLNKPIVGLAATPDGGGYWLVASDGGVFSYGDAAFHGSTGGLRLNKPIVGLAATPDGGGYWLVASDGGVFSYGDAAFHGSTGGLRLNKPIVGLAATPDGGGYWLVASDGGVFTYGDAAFQGSTGGLRLNGPVVAVAGDSARSAPVGAAAGNSAASGFCTNPSFSSSNPEATDNTDAAGGVLNWWVNNDAWNQDHDGPQTINVCNQSSWYAVSNQPNVQGMVETYPDTEYDVGGRNGHTTKTISAFHSITSTFAESNPTDANWDAAYDIWLNNWSKEIMIWNQWNGGQSFWPSQANGSGGFALTLDGVPYHFFDNGGELMFFRDTQTASGSVDILAALNWLVAHPNVDSADTAVTASDVPTQLEYGTEVAATNGPETFNVTGLTFSLS